MYLLVQASLAATPAPLYDPLATPQSPFEGTEHVVIEAAERTPGQAQAVLRNRGPADIHVTEVVVIGGAGFEVEAPAAALVVPAGQELVLDVTWTPPADETSALVVRTREGVHTVSLKGSLTSADRVPVAPPPSPPRVGAIEEPEPTPEGNAAVLGALRPGDPAIAGLIGAKGTQLGHSPAAPAEALPPGGAVGADPVIFGALDKSLIDSVIKQDMKQIRECYRRDLTRSPTLAGRVTVKFVIAKNGSVASANPKVTTFPQGQVEACVVGRFLKMQFPEPKGGGIVIVSYPFIFTPG